MINLKTINLTVSNETHIYRTNGALAGTLSVGNYVAELNTGQQPGWYSVYEADTHFQKGALKFANVHLSIDASGRVFLND